MPSVLRLSVQLGGGLVQGLLDALQSLGLTEGVRLLRNTELRDDKHSTGNTHRHTHIIVFLVRLNISRFVPTDFRTFLTDSSSVWETVAN